jgi:hypothetical protein
MEGVVAIFVIAGFGFIAAVFIYVCAVSVYLAFYFCAIVVYRVAQWAAADRSGTYKAWRTRSNSARNKPPSE